MGPGLSKMLICNATRCMTTSGGEADRYVGEYLFTPKICLSDAQDSVLHRQCVARGVISREYRQSCIEGARCPQTTPSFIAGTVDRIAAQPPSERLRCVCGGFTASLGASADWRDA